MPGAEIVYRPSLSGPGVLQSRAIAAASATAAMKRAENFIFIYRRPREFSKEQRGTAPDPSE